MLQAYIHSRMRRRTADFLQGEYPCDFLAFLMILTDPPKCSIGRDQRTRRKSGRQQAGEHLESRDDCSKSMSLITRSRTHNDVAIAMLPSNRNQTAFLSGSLYDMAGFVFPGSFKGLLLGASPETLLSRLRPPLRPPVACFQPWTEFNTCLRLIHRCQPQLQHPVSYISPQQPPSHIHRGDRPIILVFPVNVSSHPSV